MEYPEPQFWLVDLPNEILFEIFDNLNKFQLKDLLIISKRLQPLVQFLLEHKKKIRLCGDHLRVLLLSLPHGFEEVVLDNDVNYPGFKGNSVVGRLTLIPRQVFEESTTLTFQPLHNRIVVNSHSIRHHGKKRKISLIAGSREPGFRPKLWSHAAAADLCVFVVDPKEIELFAEEIKEMIFGACFMSARNVVVIIDMRNYPLYSPDSKLARWFQEARSKVATLLNKTVGPCYKIIPANIKYGYNISKRTYEWFSGPTLRELILEDQFRTNFDEVAFKNLCEEPLKIQLFDMAKNTPGNLAIPTGFVISGTLKMGEEIRVQPQGYASPVQSIATYNDPQYAGAQEARPGDVMGFALNIPASNVFSHFGYIVKHKGDMESVICTIAFRASIGVLKPKDFVQNRTYLVLYGPSLIKCVLWWILPEADKKKQALRKAIFLPLIHYDIEPYKASPFEKNYRGKVMLLEHGAIVGAGRVDSVINFSTHTYYLPTTQDYALQYGKVVSEASSFFSLPSEQKLHDSFVEYISNNKEAKNSILQLKPLLESRYW